MEVAKKRMASLLPANRVKWKLGERLDVKDGQV